MYVLSYQGPSFKNAAVVIVDTKVDAGVYIANLPDDYIGIVIDHLVDSPSLRRASSALLVTLHNALADEPVEKFQNQAAGRAALMRLVEQKAVPVQPEMLLASAPEEAQTADAPNEDSDNDDTLDSALGDQETAPGTATETAPDTATQTEEANMAKAKTKAKVKKAPKAPKAVKAKDGLPRAGTKKAELLRLLQREKGATMAEMLEATGWKACLGTAKAVTEAAKLKFSHERGTDGKPSRWYAK